MEFISVWGKLIPRGRSERFGRGLISQSFIFAVSHYGQSTKVEFIHISASCWGISIILRSWRTLIMNRPGKKDLQPLGVDFSPLRSCAGQWWRRSWWIPVLQALVQDLWLHSPRNPPAPLALIIWRKGSVCLELSRHRERLGLAPCSRAPWGCEGRGGERDRSWRQGLEFPALPTSSPSRCKGQRTWLRWVTESWNVWVRLELETHPVPPLPQAGNWIVLRSLSIPAVLQFFKEITPCLTFIMYKIVVCIYHRNTNRASKMRYIQQGQKRFISTNQCNSSGPSNIRHQHTPHTL